jgi:hypothetical protein
MDRFISLENVAVDIGGVRLAPPSDIHLGNRLRQRSQDRRSCSPPAVCCPCATRIDNFLRRSQRTTASRVFPCTARRRFRIDRRRQCCLVSSQRERGFHARTSTACPVKSPDSSASFEAARLYSELKDRVCPRSRDRDLVSSCLRRRPLTTAQEREMLAQLRAAPMLAQSYLTLSIRSRKHPLPGRCGSGGKSMPSPGSLAADLPRGCDAILWMTGTRALALAYQTLRDAVSAFVKFIERPANPAAEIADRLKKANKLAAA